MLNRRYLGWLIAGAYVAPQGGFRPPDPATLGATLSGTYPAAGITEPRQRPFAVDATHSSPIGHRSITAEG